MQTLTSQPSSNTQVPVVHNLSDAFKWNHHVISKIKRSDDGEDCDSPGWNMFLNHCSDSTYSTSCSGVDAPAAAISDLHWATISAAATHSRIVMPRCLFAIEWDKSCQDELAVLHRTHAASAGHSHGVSTGLHSEACRFGDLAGFFDSSVTELLPTLMERPEIALEALCPLIKQNRGMRDHSPCLTHNKMCKVKAACRHIAGTSCTAWSAQGANAGEYDSTVIYFVAWCGMRRMLQEPLVIYENVRSKKLLSVLTEMLSDIYWVDDVGYLCPNQQGFPGERERQYVLMRHRSKIASLVDPLSNFSKRVRRECACTFREYFWQHTVDPEFAANDSTIPFELESDRKWVASRKTVPRHNVPHGAPATDLYLNSLTSMERMHLELYKENRHDTDHVFQLNQHGRDRPIHSHGPLLMTLIRNMGICWTAAVQPARWMSGSEALCAMGFRLAPCARVPYVQCSFQVRRTGRTARVCRQQAGNTMHVSSIGVVLAHSFANVVFQIDDTHSVVGSSLFLNIMRLRRGTTAKALL